MMRSLAEKVGSCGISIRAPTPPAARGPRCHSLETGRRQPPHRSGDLQHMGAIGVHLERNATGWCRRRRVGGAAVVEGAFSDNLEGIAWTGPRSTVPKGDAHHFFAARLQDRWEKLSSVKFPGAFQGDSAPKPALHGVLGPRCTTFLSNLFSNMRCLDRVGDHRRSPTIQN